MNNTILCFDLGTKTGWAIRGASGDIFSGTVNFQSRRFEGGGMRYLRFKQWLSEIKQTAGQIDAVYFEEVRRHKGTDAAHVYGGLLATLTAWCEQHQIPYEGIAVSTIKKATTGKGNASKEEMIKAVRAKGHNPKDDNEADALAILYLVKEREDIHVYY
ncbi:crossover junction endodeoxyribonuclease RuvC [Bartonella sp. CM120XJJH]|uniref:crossover junction endodeoxyribonuclease RuvC n=1 Tax=Bartonella sp. CM120XJJH TaxID=3243544 RepID=UPI0035CF753B